MIRAALSVPKALALTLRCDYCDASPGVWCVRRSRATGEATGRASWLHGARTWRFEDAYHAGVCEGRVWTFSEVAQDIDPDLRWSALTRGELGTPQATWQGLRDHLAARLESNDKWRVRAREQVADHTGLTVST